MSTANMFALAKMTARPAALGRRCLGTKVATGLVGLPVSEDGVADLAAVSESILNEIQVSSREEGLVEIFMSGFSGRFCFCRRGAGASLDSASTSCASSSVHIICTSAFC